MPERVIPRSYLTPAKIERVVCHWSAGAYRVSGLDRKHYHVILQDDAALRTGSDVTAVRGIHTPADNDNCVDRKYAAHTKGLNTRSFGLSVACMHDAARRGPYGKYPLTLLLWERMAQAAAEICEAYGLPVTERTVLFHSEALRVYGKPQAGKWDIDVLPWNPTLPPDDVHAEFRRKTGWYLAREKGDR